MARRGGTSATTPPPSGHFLLFGHFGLPGAHATALCCQIQGRRNRFLGPSFLYTYRDIAEQGESLFPLWNQLNGTQPAEGIRSFIGVSYFFLKGRR